ncbi:MAG TPA: hypothetical protein VJ372_02250 [Pyrinomonadaceae bacterium]|nr:hypothetical protein [Pyrinomonadaceae bacterium]
MKVPGDKSSPLLRIALESSFMPVASRVHLSAFAHFVFFFLSDPNGVWRFYLVKKESLKSEREQQIYELLLLHEIEFEPTA